MPTIALELNKIYSDEKQNMTPFIQTQKQKQLSMKLTLIMYFD